MYWWNIYTHIRYIHITRTRIEQIYIPGTTSVCMGNSTNQYYLLTEHTHTHTHPHTLTHERTHPRNLVWTKCTRVNVWVYSLIQQIIFCWILHAILMKLNFTNNWRQLGPKIAHLERLAQIKKGFTSNKCQTFRYFAWWSIGVSYEYIFYKLTFVLRTNFFLDNSYYCRSVRLSVQGRSCKKIFKMADMTVILDLCSEQFGYFLSRSYFLLSFEPIRLWVQEEEFKMGFQDGRCDCHFGFWIGTVLAIFVHFQEKFIIDFRIETSFKYFWSTIALIRFTKFRVNSPSGPGEEVQNWFSRWRAGLGGSVGRAVRLETRRSRVQPPPRSATFYRGDWSWNIFYGHSLPSADSRRAVVSFWRKNVHNTG